MNVKKFYRTLSRATTPTLSRHESNGRGVLCIPQSSSLTGASPSNCLMSYPGHLLGGVLPLCRDAVSVFYFPSWLVQTTTVVVVTMILLLLVVVVMMMMMIHLKEFFLITTIFLFCIPQVYRFLLQPPIYTCKANKVSKKNHGKV